MLEIRNVNKSFGSLEVIRDLSLDVEDGEILALVGPSGCGKSTLLNLISGIEAADAGTITGDISTVAYVFQDDRLLPWKTVYENIAIVKDDERRNAAKAGTRRKEILNLIEAVGLKGFEDYKPDQLSGGMKKRCGIARAFYYGSRLLLMDEPFSGLDYYLREEMLEMLLRIWEQYRQSIIFVTHEIDEALTIANRVAVMTDGQIRRIFMLPPQKDRDILSDEMTGVRREILEIIRGRRRKENV